LEKFRNGDAEIDIGRTVECKLVGIRMIKYEEKWERMIRKNDNEVGTHLNDQ
jgi:hypothetical protein